MVEVIIYTTKTCPYCVKAKALFAKKKINFQEKDASNDLLREEMLGKSNGKKSVPQIFIDGLHIGGCDDLYELDRLNKLDPLLKN